MTTNEELREMIAGLARSQAETAEQMKETDRLQRENAAQIKEIRQNLKETSALLDRTIKENTRQHRELNAQIAEMSRGIGDLGNKFGAFTEGMALPSMEKILGEQFGLDDVLPRRKRKLNGKSIEIDVLAYDSTGVHNEVFIIEVKSRLRREDIDQTLRIIADFPRFFPELSDRKIYGVIAAVDIPTNLPAEVNEAGLYLACISDDIFKLLAPRGFHPKAFGPAAQNNGHKNGRKAPTKSRTETKKR